MISVGLIEKHYTTCHDIKVPERFKWLRRKSKDDLKGVFSQTVVLWTSLPRCVKDDEVSCCEVSARLPRELGKIFYPNGETSKKLVQISLTIEDKTGYSKAAILFQEQNNEALLEIHSLESRSVKKRAIGLYVRKSGGEPEKRDGQKQALKVFREVLLLVRKSKNRIDSLNCRTCAAQKNSLPGTII